MRSCKPVTLQEKTEDAQKQFEGLVGRGVRRDEFGFVAQSKYVSNPQVGNSSDNILAFDLASGARSAEEVKALSRMVSRPARAARPGLAAAKPRMESIYDIMLEEMAMADDLLVAHRATASEIADARRAYMAEARTDILNELGVIPSKSEMSKLAKANLTYMGMLREGYMISPARVGAAATMDAMGNSWFQIMTGHLSSGARTLNPLHWLAFSRHTMQGTKLQHPTLDLLNNLGESTPSGIIDNVTRDLFEISSDTVTSDIFSIGGRLPGGRAVSRVFASKWGRALRHAIDQNARLSLFGDQLGRLVKQKRLQLYRDLRGTYGDGVAQDIIDDLGRNADFSPTTLNETLTRHGIDEHDALARRWRQDIADSKVLAKKEVERVHFSGKMTNADEYARHVMLFHFWQSRAMLFYPKTVLSNPYLLYNHVKMYNALDEEAEKQGYDNIMSLYFKWQKDGTGWFFQFDPISYLVPYTMFRDLAVSYNGETSVDKWIRRFGAFVHPGIMAGLSMLGQSSSFPSLTPPATRNAIRAVLNWDRNNGYDVFGRGYGMTDDVVTEIEQRVMDGVNNQLHEWFPDFVPDKTPFDYQRTDVATVKAIIIEQAEDDFGMTYQQMQENEDPKYIDEVTAALIAVDTGQPNDRAERAMSEWTTWDQVVQTGTRAIVPGYVPVKNEAYEDYKADNFGSYESGGPDSPTEENAQEVMDSINSGSPEAQQLNADNAQLQELGSEWEQSVYQGWTEIAFGDLPPRMSQEIGGVVYSSEDVMEMTQDERFALADQWVQDQIKHDTPTEPVNGVQLNSYEAYKDDRDRFIESRPQLKGFDNYKGAIRKYNDPTYGEGVRGWRLYLESGAAPEFAQEIGLERDRLQDQGVTGPELEERLDMWTLSESGYNAYRGVKDELGDQDPIAIQDSSETPVPLPMDQSSSTTTTGTKSNSSAANSSSTAPSDNGSFAIPQWQTDLIAEVETYTAAMDDLEAQYGDLSQYSNTVGQNELKKLLPEMSPDLVRFINWSQKDIQNGGDGSIESYLDYRNEQYKDNND